MTKPITEEELAYWAKGGGECNCPGFLAPNPAHDHWERCPSVRGRLVDEVRRLRASLIDLIFAAEYLLEGPNRNEVMAGEWDIALRTWEAKSWPETYHAIARAKKALSD